jgi:hypothetical protein
MPKEVNNFFVGQPLDLKGADSNPPGPPGPLELIGYFGLSMVNPSRPPLPPNKPYCWSFNYFGYVKDFDLDIHVRFLKLPLKQIMKQMMHKLLICLVLPSKILCLISVTIIWEITQIIFL